jgi:hypothetical protein
MRAGSKVSQKQQRAWAPQKGEAMTINNCSCGREITRGDLELYRAACVSTGRSNIQVCEGSETDLELVQCPACRSHRAIEIPKSVQQ